MICVTQDQNLLKLFADEIVINTLEYQQLALKFKLCIFVR